MIYKFCCLLGIILYKLLFRFKSAGRENFPPKGGCILASNHLSHLDPLALGIPSYRRLNFMARKSLFNNKLFAKFLNSVDAFAVEDKDLGLSGMKEALRRLKAGKVVALFPEGTRSKDGKLHPGKIGVGLLALKSNVPIVPARIFGTDQALPIGARFIRLRPVSVYFGRPLRFGQSYQQGNKKDNYLRASQSIMEQISKLGPQVK
ncbi:MAG: lysophospholipid acyltransferase family protein [Candidatus Omnitrophota bacterium]|nr:lysophospholipid acyltransferase family protein [Candidatus Omnitrophota bacterium]